MLCGMGAHTVIYYYMSCANCGPSFFIIILFTLVHFAKLAYCLATSCALSQDCKNLKAYTQVQFSMPIPIRIHYSLKSYYIMSVYINKYNMPG